MNGRFLYLFTYLFIYLLSYLFIYLEAPIIIFDFSLYAAESNNGKTGEIWHQGNVHRKACSRDTEDLVTDSFNRDCKETVLEFGRIRASVLMIRSCNNPFICNFVLPRYNLDIGRQKFLKIQKATSLGTYAIAKHARSFDRCIVAKRSTR